VLLGKDNFHQTLDLQVLRSALCAMKMKETNFCS